jgi:hypothetical protein
LNFDFIPLLAETIPNNKIGYISYNFYAKLFLKIQKKVRFDFISLLAETVPKNNPKNRSFSC